MARVREFEEDWGFNWNTRKMQNNVSIHPNHVPLLANVQALDKLWRKGDPGSYEPNCQGPNATMSDNSVVKMQRLQSAYDDDTKLPMIRIVPTGTGIGIIDGRHRFMFARDICQQKNIFVAVEKEDIQLVQGMLLSTKTETFLLGTFGEEALPLNRPYSRQDNRGRSREP
jgi:hypothetical protein